MISQWGCKAGFANHHFTRVYYLLQKYKNPPEKARKLADTGPQARQKSSTLVPHFFPSKCYLCTMQPYPIQDTDSFESLLGTVKAGFPSPADDFREKLDLVKLLVRHSASTFFFQIDGVSMVDADMDEGDIIIVDRALEPYNGCKAVCFIDGEYTVKRVEIYESGAILLPCNEHNTQYHPIPVGPDNDFLIWGIVTWVIKKA